MKFEEKAAGIAKNRTNFISAPEGCCLGLTILTKGLCAVSKCRQVDNIRLDKYR